MILPDFMIGFMIIMIGFIPIIFIQPLARIVGIFTQNTLAIQQIIPTLNNISLASGIFILILGIGCVLRAWQQKKQTVSQDSTWGCAYTGANPARHQYTATSYADSFVQLSSALVNVKKDFKDFSEDEIFPQPRNFETHSSDIFENRLVALPSNTILYWLKKIAVFQTGKIQHYLLYALVFLVVIFILTYFKLI